jgi:DNA-binding NarL/FixJ family response regulator
VDLDGAVGWCGDRRGDLDPGGRDSGPARAPLLRDQVMSALTSGCPSASLSSGLDMWNALIAGHWHCRDHFESGIACCFAIGRAAAGGSGALSELERDVVARAVCGEANKEIAYALDVTTSTAATHLRRGLRKLGFPSRRALVLFHCLVIAAPAGDALRAVELVHDGESLLAIRACPARLATGLTPSESDVAWAAARGLSNEAIARERGRSERTIANQLAAVFQKLRVSSRSGLASALVARAVAGTTG